MAAIWRNGETATRRHGGTAARRHGEGRTSGSRVVQTRCAMQCCEKAGCSTSRVSGESGVWSVNWPCEFRKSGSPSHDADITANQPVGAGPGLGLGLGLSRSMLALWMHLSDSPLTLWRLFFSFSFLFIISGFFLYLHVDIKAWQPISRPPCQVWRGRHVCHSARRVSNGSLHGPWKHRNVCRHE